MMDKKIIISIMLPLASVFILALIFLYTKPEITGFAVAVNISNASKLIDADITLKTNAKELIPEAALIVVYVDEQRASMPIKDFIQKTGSPYEYANGTFSKLDYKGYGFTGNYTYKLNLSEFDINRQVLPSSHLLKTQIVFNGKVLFESERMVVIV